LPNLSENLPAFTHILMARKISKQIAISMVDLYPIRWKEKACKKIRQRQSPSKLLCP